MRRLTSQSIRGLAAHVGAVLLGDGSVIISGIASIESAKEGDLVFASDSSKLQQAVASRAAAIVTGEFAQPTHGSKPILVALDPKLAFARLAALLVSEHKREGHDESAQIHLSAQVGEHVWIGPGVVIEECVGIGDGSSIEANSVIGAGVVLGKQCRIGPNVTIYSGTQLGDRVGVQAGSVLGSAGFGYVRDEQGHYRLFPQIGRLVIEDDAEIGANCTVDRGALDATIIGRGTKIDNLVHVGHNVQIGEDVVIAAQTGISGSSRIESGAIVGGQVGIGERVTVESGVIVGSKSGILSDKILRGKGVVFWGVPARPLKQYLKELATLARLSRSKER